MSKYFELEASENKAYPDIHNALIIVHNIMSKATTKSSTETIQPVSAAMESWYLKKGQDVEEDVFQSERKYVIFLSFVSLYFVYIPSTFAFVLLTLIF